MKTESIYSMGKYGHTGGHERTGIQIKKTIMSCLGHEMSLGLELVCLREAGALVH